MILVDTGPLVALLDKGQGEAHRRCTAAYQNLTAPLLTTWCCLTEAMYFLYELRGWSAQSALWQFVERKALFLHAADSKEQRRMKALMEQYQNVPMDLADASLVAVAETRGSRRIFTLDSDFYIYRLYGKDPFEIIP
ncbi:MAG: type II toxin-antitoxin system VapC family toxin [Microcystaceae cyanobacterium]